MHVPPPTSSPPPSTTVDMHIPDFMVSRLANNVSQLRYPIIYPDQDIQKWHHFCTCTLLNSNWKWCHFCTCIFPPLVSHSVKTGSDITSVHAHAPPPPTSPTVDMHTPDFMVSGLNNNVSQLRYLIIYPNWHIWKWHHSFACTLLTFSILIGQYCIPLYPVQSKPEVT